MSAAKPSSGQSSSLGGLIWRLVAIMILTALNLWLIYSLLAVGSSTATFLAVMVGIIEVGIVVFFLREDLYPFRWLTPGLSLLILLVAYPIMFTLYSAFTNYGTGHLLGKEQAIEQILKVTYLPEGEGNFTWTAFVNDSDEFLIWFVDGEGQGLLTSPTAIEDVADYQLGALDGDGVPQSIQGYDRLNRLTVVRYLTVISDQQWGDPETPLIVQSLDRAARVQQRYQYDAEADTLTDLSDGTVLTPIDGTFTAPDGREVRPGWFAVTGLDNFTRIVTDPRFRGPFLRIFAWTLSFAFLSVATTFAFGLFMAIVFNDTTLPGRKIIRSLLLIPYAIPAFITVMVWRGILNPELGIISRSIGFGPPWFTNEWWARAGIILVNLWLGFPYMMLITTGALQAIPGDLYEAAEVDGANPWQQFSNITLPLLLVAVGPLLIGSFAFNFNNFTVIDIYNEGGPPIPNSPTPAGHTDILISYTYRVAFAGGRGVDYGYASAITIVIFLVLAAITAFQFRFTSMWEDISENV